MEYERNGGTVFSEICRELNTFEEFKKSRRGEIERLEYAKWCETVCIPEKLINLTPHKVYLFTRRPSGSESNI